MEFVLYKKRGVGEAVHTYVLLSLPPHKKERKVGAKDFTHVCEFSSFPAEGRRIGLVFLGGGPLSDPPSIIPLPEVSRIVMFDLGIDGLLFFVFLLCNRIVGFLD